MCFMKNVKALRQKRKQFTWAGMHIKGQGRGIKQGGEKWTVLSVPVAAGAGKPSRIYPMEHIKACVSTVFIVFRGGSL